MDTMFSYIIYIYFRCNYLDDTNNIQTRIVKSHVIVVETYKILAYNKIACEIIGINFYRKVRSAILHNCTSV